MEAIQFNLGKWLINLVPGWFLVSFLQVIAISLFTGAWADVWGRFTAIALFRNGGGVLVNIIVIVVVSAVTVPIWLLTRKPV